MMMGRITLKTPPVLAPSYANVCVTFSESVSCL